MPEEERQDIDIESIDKEMTEIDTIRLKASRKLR